MSSEAETVKKKGKRTLTPKLRFPEFREQWDEVELSQLADSISDRVGTMPCIPYTVTSGLGLVSQQEKLGRTIAGNSLRNYIRLQKGDFAYNKSATKAYPEGYVARYLDEAKAAVPNSIFTCFRVDTTKVDPAYLDFLFAGNLHGRWLRKFITIGARAHGSLNVSDDDLMALPVPLPSPPEQQKIADCLSSLDGLIAAADRILEALKAHKKGLMQQLFPQPGQTRPRLRFPEFLDKGEWGEKTLGELSTIIRGGSPRPIDSYLTKETSGLNWLKIGDVDKDAKYVYSTEEKVIPEALSKTREVNTGDFILSNSMSFGRPYLLKMRTCIHDGWIAVTDITEAIHHEYLYYAIMTSRSQVFFEDQAAGGGVRNLNKDIIKSLPIGYPKIPEQQRIADCLAALDTRIAAQAAKIDALKQHKRGLMQQLFPAPEEQ